MGNRQEQNNGTTPPEDPAVHRRRLTASADDDDVDEDEAGGGGEGGAGAEGDTNVDNWEFTAVTAESATFTESLLSLAAPGAFFMRA